MGCFRFIKSALLQKRKFYNQFVMTAVFWKTVSNLYNFYGNKIKCDKNLFLYCSWVYSNSIKVPVNLGRGRTWCLFQPQSALAVLSVNQIKRVWPCLSLYLKSQNTSHHSAHCEIKKRSCSIFRFILSNDIMLVSFHCSVLALKWAYLPKFLLKLLLFLSIWVKVFERSNDLVWPILLHSALSEHWLSLWHFKTPIFIFNTWWVFFECCYH